MCTHSFAGENGSRAGTLATTTSKSDGVLPDFLIVFLHEIRAGSTNCMGALVVLTLQGHPCCAIVR